LKSIAGGADLIARADIDAYGAGPDRPAQVPGAASSAGTPALQSSGIGDWRPATSTIVAFFDVNTLAGLRVEDPRHVSTPSIGWSKS